MARSLPKNLARIVERLELDQPQIVTLEQLEVLSKEANIRTPAALIAHRLRASGWLLSTGLSGAWEFAPGAHAGPYSRGGPLLPVLAAIALRPGLKVALALNSAAWAHGFEDRTPSRAVLAMQPGARVPAGLRRLVRIVNFPANLTPIICKGVPVHRLETLLVHLAARPTHVTSWGAVAEWLGDVVAEAEEASILTELAGRPRAVRVRLAYLLEGVWPNLADRLGADSGTRVWFGPRRKLRRHSQRWRVADSILPFDPSKLTEARSS